MSALTASDVGRWVVYKRTGDIGRIKSWNDKWVFVVYHCDGDWDNFENYTAAATCIDDLTLCCVTESWCGGCSRQGGCPIEKLTRKDGRHEQRA